MVLIELLFRDIFGNSEASKVKLFLWFAYFKLSTSIWSSLSHQTIY